MRRGTSRNWRSSLRIGVMLSYFRTLWMMRAAAWITLLRQFIVLADKRAKLLLLRSILELINLVCVCVCACVCCVCVFLYDYVTMFLCTFVCIFICVCTCVCVCFVFVLRMYNDYVRPCKPSCLQLPYAISFFFSVTYSYEGSVASRTSRPQCSLFPPS